MIVTFDEVWYFIETTHVEYDVIELIHPQTGFKIPSEIYTTQTPWERRHDMNVLRNLWEECYSFIIHGSCVTPDVRQVIEEVEQDHNVDAQAHIYMGKYGSRSFDIHSDEPDNLIVQCIGKSKVTIYNEYSSDVGIFPDANVTIKEQHILEPGNSIFIPSKQFHLFEPLTDRLSISIPMIKR